MAKSNIFIWGLQNLRYKIDSALISFKNKEIDFIEIEFYKFKSVL